MTASFPALVNRPSLIEYKQYRFLVMDAPTDANLPAYVDVLKKKHAVALVRACEPTYKTQPIVAAGIRMIDMPFDDGDPPPEHLLTQWLQLVNECFGGGAAKEKPSKSDKSDKSDKKALESAHAAASSGDLNAESSPGKICIGVHCVAGLGRAPVLVAIALIEAGMAPFEAIEFVRKKRRGAINARQLKYLENYKPRKKTKDAGCVIC